MNQVFNMLGRILTRHLMNWGTNKAIDQMSRSGSKTGPEAAKQSREMRGNAKRMRQAVDLLRRMSR